MGRLNKTELHEAVDELTFEVARLYFRMRIAATQHLGHGQHSSGRRSILRSLGNDGPQTVPEMARVRSVSRQHIQSLVDGLLSDGLVRRIDNPRHQRSKLVTLTARGEGFFKEMERREAVLFSFLGRGIPLDDLRTTTEVVCHLREKLESGQWTRYVEDEGNPGESR